MDSLIWHALIVAGLGGAGYWLLFKADLIIDNSLKMAKQLPEPLKSYELWKLRKPAGTKATYQVAGGVRLAGGDVDRRDVRMEFNRAAADTGGSPDSRRGERSAF